MADLTGACRVYPVQCVAYFTGVRSIDCIGVECLPRLSERSVDPAIGAQWNEVAVNIPSGWNLVDIPLGPLGYYLTGVGQNVGDPLRRDRTGVSVPSNACPVK